MRYVFDFAGGPHGLDLVSAPDIEHLIIPDSISYNGNRYEVNYISIGSQTFNNVKIIDIPKGVSLWIGLFQNWPALESINVATDHGWKRSIDGVLYSRTANIGNWTDLQKCPPKTPLTSLTVPPTVRMIHYGALKDCINLTKVELPDDVAQIEGYAFSGCTALESVNTLGKITELGYGVFWECNNLKSITIPSTVTKIGSGAFSGCQQLDKIELPSAVSVIADMAFANCSSIQSMTIPEGVTIIDVNTFIECTSLESVEVPSTIKRINFGAFQGCSSLKSILLPEGLEIMEDHVFDHCSSLQSINIPSTLMTIPSGAFYNCSALSSIDFAEGLDSIAPNAFEACQSLTEITLPQGLRSIGAYAFQDCSNLKSIVIPEGVTYIDYGAFSGCKDLETMYFPSTLTHLSNGALPYNNSLTSITFASEVPPTLILGNVLSLNENVVVYVPKNSVETYKKWTQNRCKVMPIGSILGFDYDNLKYSVKDDGVSVEVIGTIDGYEPTTLNIASEISFEGTTFEVIEIGENAFKDCSSLESVILPSSLIKIADKAFNNCSALACVNLPENLEIIGNNAFQDCSQLNSISLPESLTSIGSRAFQGCFRLTSIEIPSLITDLSDGILQYCSLQSIKLPEGLQTIGQSALAMNSELDSINIPGSVRTIRDQAFFGCRGLKTIEFPSSLDSIGAISMGQTNITSVTFNSSIPPKVTDGDELVRLNSDVTIYVPAQSVNDYRAWTSYPVKIIGVNYEFNKDGVRYSINADEETLTIIGYTEIIGSDLDIPAQVTYNEQSYRVVNIAKEAFKDCSYLKSVVLPEGLIFIDDRSFESCENLATITIPNSVINLGDYVFWTCDSLSILTLPEALTSMGSNAIGNNGLKTINFLSSIPPSVSPIDCLVNLNEDVIIYVPAESVDAYKAWTNYTVMAIGSVVSDEFEYEGLMYRINKDSETPSVELIGVAEGNTDANVTIPSTAVNNDTEEYSVVGIAANAFADNQDIKSITIPASVVVIGDGAFAGCDSLTVTMPGNNVTMGEGVFSGCSDLAVNVTPTEGSEGSGDNTTLGIGFAGTPITEVTISDEITEIADGAFKDCSELTSVVIPDKVETIGASTFENCTSLESVTLGNGVATIAPDAFAGSEAITEVICLSTTPPAFEVISRAAEGFKGFEQSVYDNATLIVPAGTEQSYREADVWKNFVKIQEVADVKVTVTMPEQVILFEGENFRLTPVITPADVEGLTVGYSSDRTYVATVDGNGYISAVGVGVAGITVTVKDKNGKEVASATTNVAVGNDVSQLYDNITIPVYRAMMVPLVLEPLDYLIGFMTCEAENPEIVTAYNNGSIYGTRVGETMLNMTFGQNAYTCKVKVVSEIRDIEIHTGNGTNTVVLGEPLKLYATTPDGDPVPVTWEMYSSPVASINYYTGEVTAVQDGSCTIIARAVFDPDLVAYYVLNVTSNPVRHLVLDKSVLEMTEGETEQLIATVTPANADAEITWTSSDDTVATVDTATGEVTAVSAGTATITVRDAVTGISTNCTVTVSKPSGIDGIDSAAISVRAESGRIIVTGAPTDASVEVFDIAGSRIALERGDCTVSVNTGIYVVRVAGTTVKVAVK